MMNTNLLDLNNDVLNIIGEYVKKDNMMTDYNFNKKKMKKRKKSFLNMLLVN